jgi:hypothetical protein
MTPSSPIPALAQAFEIIAEYGRDFVFTTMSGTALVLCTRDGYRGPVAGDFLLAFQPETGHDLAWRLTWRDQAGKEHERTGSLAEMLSDAHQALHGERLPLRVRTPAQTATGVTPDGQRWYSRGDG